MKALVVSAAQQISFVLIHYVALAIAALLAYSIGRRLTRRLSYHSEFESIVFSTALGLGVIAYVIFFLGLLKLLYVPILILALLLLFAFGFSEVRDVRRLRLSKRVAFPVFLILALAVPLMLMPLYPVTAWDATAYHLASAKIFATGHEVVLTPYLRYAVAPMLNQMLFTGALVLGDGNLAQQVELLLLALLLLALFAVARRHLNDRTGLLAVALLASSPYVIWLATVGYIDVCLMLYCFLACYAFWNWRETGLGDWLIVSGVLFGLAISTKYPALFLLLLFSASMFVTGKRFSLRTAVVPGAVALLVASPWFIRNFYYTHNPVFPFLHDVLGPVFGYGVWSPEFYAGQGGRGLSEGLGRGFRELLMLPWNVTFRPKAFAGELEISPLYPLVLPFAIVGALKLRTARLMLAVAVAFTLFWFFTYQSLRYLLPAVPFFCLGAAAGIDWVLNRLHSIRTFFERPIVIAALCIAIALPGLRFAAFEVYYERWHIPLSYASREYYLRARLPTYPLYDHLNRVKGRNYKVYALFDSNLSYYADGVHMGDWFGPARFSLIWPKVNSGEDLWRELRALGADYFIVNQVQHKVQLPDDAYFHDRFHPILYARDAVLYELSEPARVNSSR